MPPSRARLGCAIATAAVSLLAASRARGESVADAGTDFVAESIDIPVAADSRAPAAPRTTIDLARFAGEQNSVAELLAAAPGTTLRALGGPLQTATVSLRGASADESLVLFDGIPLHGPGGGAFDLSAIPAQLISQIVVHRGVLGAQLGAGALGGAIEIVPRGASENAHGGVSASYGSFNTAQLALDASGGEGSALEGFTGALQLDGTTGNFNYQYSFTPSVAGSPLVTGTRANDDARRLGFLLRDERQLGPGMTLDLIALGSFGEVGQPGPIVDPTPTARSQDEGGIVGARLKMLAGSAVLSARAWAQGDQIALSGLSDSFVDCTISPNDPSCTAKNHSLAARGSVEAGFPIGGAQWVTVSLEGGSDWFAGPGEGAHQRGAGSLALRDDVALFGGALAIFPALRLDAIGPDFAASPALGISAHPFSTIFAGALKPLELRASGGTSFRAPTFAELYLREDATAPNPALLPERAGSIDAGAAWHTPRVTIAGSLFWSRYRELILYERVPPAEEKPFNVGQALILGAELEALVSLPLGFSAKASWSFLDAANESPGATENGERLPYRPPHRLFARLARRGDRLEGFAQLQFSSAMPRNQFNTTFLPSQFTIDCGVGARIVGPLWADLELKNALDDETLQDLFQYPLPGVSLTAIARARF